MSGAVSEGMTYFAAFGWPMPESFAAAVAANRFELGDVLYRSPLAYEAWSGSPASNGVAVQVLDPPRSVRGALVDGDLDRRRANWASPVRILLVDPSARIPSQERVLTQGQLLTAWWRGDELWLEADAPEPEFPKTGRELFGCLESMRDALVARATTRATKSRVRAGSVFALVVDLASDSSRAKARGVLEQLRSGGAVKSFDLSPAEAGVNEADAYHPSLVLRVHLLPERNVESVESQLRTVLYRGGAPATAESEKGSTEAAKKAAPADRFSIGRHGLLFSL